MLDTIMWIPLAVPDLSCVFVHAGQYDQHFDDSFTVFNSILFAMHDCVLIILSMMIERSAPDHNRTFQISFHLEQVYTLSFY